ncbi:MAG: aldehyde dehydrogenase family protein [Bdellovibrionota bacterium]
MNEVFSHRLWIAGAWQGSAEGREVRSPFDGSTVSRVDQASKEQMKLALDAAVEAAKVLRKTSRYLRAQLLSGIAEEISFRREEFVKLISRESGKPVTLADVEVGRALVTFATAAEEAKRFGGEVIPVDVDVAGRPYLPALSYWVPRGPVLGITPFNFPLNLVAHKVAPALASGNSIVIKPAPQAPGAAVLLAQVFEKVAKKIGDSREKIPLAGLQVVSCSNDVAAAAVTDPRITTLSFTGSTSVGWMLQSKAVGKRVLLELGGNAAVIVHSDADLERAASRSAAGGHGYAGQSCISVQRIYVHESCAERFIELLIKETSKLGVGDPAAKDVVVGPLIDAAAADRVMEWIAEAKKSGAKVLTGGTREKNVIAPTVLSNVSPSSKVVCEEVFGPVVVVETYREFSEAIEKVNDSRFGLQAGVFTDSQKLMREAVEKLDVGGILLNEIPTYRADPMPYGGVKESGLGREGLRYAMEEFSERRTVVQWIG